MITKNKSVRLTETNLFDFSNETKPKVHSNDESKPKFKKITLEDFFEES